MSETPSTNDRDVLIDGHSYDGIQEYDNPMPRWWLIIFYITIAWSAYYVVGIELGWINTYEKDLAAETADIDALRAATKQIDVTPEYLAGVFGDAEVLAVGKTAFESTCAACHGNNGGGTIGPNLTDVEWIHGGSPMEIYKVVEDGVLAKGMPAWRGVLSQDRIIGVVAFIESIRDTNVAGGKAPEGTEYVPE